MKNKIFSFSFILFFSIFTIFASCGKQKAEWKGTIEEIDGVTVVKNPKEPIYNEDVFNIDENLTIGQTEGEEEYMFQEILHLATLYGITLTMHVSVAFKPPLSVTIS